SPSISSLPLFLGSCLYLDSSFFSDPAPHLHLHPFPTRRSSDLCIRSSTLICGDPPVVILTTASVLQATFCKTGSKCSGLWEGRRSEEHTSELQSRFDLVCRLLLEKKKISVTQMYQRTESLFLY